MKGNYRQPSAGIQQRNGFFHHRFHRPQLVVDGDADGLKAALGRVLLLPQSGSGHGAFDHVYQLQRRLDGRLLPAAADGCGDPGRKELLAVIIQNTLEFLVRPCVHDLTGVPDVLAVHAHIQRRVRHIGKAPLPVVQLGRGNPQIQQNAVHLVDAQFLERLIHVAEIGVNQRDPVFIGLQPFRRRFQRHVVPVDADEPPGCELRGNAAGMSRAA